MRVHYDSPNSVNTCINRFFSSSHILNRLHESWSIIKDFFSYLSLFTFMMIILVTVSNFLLMCLLVEKVLCLFLFISKFWFYQNSSESKFHLFLTNRVGDCFLTLYKCLLWYYKFGSLTLFFTVFSLSPRRKYREMLLLLLVFVC